VTLHPGFDGSEGNPVGSGDQIILVGANAFGVAIAVAADCTRDGARIAVVHINTVAEIEGMDGRDVIRGSRRGDIADAGAGNDRIVTSRGWDVIDAGAGNDDIKPRLWRVYCQGGEGNDAAHGRKGDDTFIFATGDGHDGIVDFDRRGDDRLALSVDGIEGFDDVVDHAYQDRRGPILDFGNGDSILLKRVDIEDLRRAISCLDRPRTFSCDLPGGASGPLGA